MMKYRVMPHQIMRRNALKCLLKKAQKESGRKDLSVLEIGYGSGHIFEMYASLGLKSFGYDFSEKAYSTASQQPAVKNGSAVLYKSWDEVPISRFDVVVACEVLEHCEDDAGQLSKWLQYLNNNRGAIQLLFSPSLRIRKDSIKLILLPGTAAATQKRRCKTLCAPAT